MRWHTHGRASEEEKGTLRVTQHTAQQRTGAQEWFLPPEQSGIFFGFIPFLVGWEWFFLFDARGLISRVSAIVFWVFSGCFLVFLLFFGGVFVTFVIFFIFFIFFLV